VRVELPMSRRRGLPRGPESLDYTDFQTPMPASFPLRHRLLVLMVALAGLLGVTAAAHAYEIGISEQKVGVWTDPRFEQLQIKQVRLLVYYDLVIQRDFRRYDRWMKNARARGAEVLLTINHHSRVNTRLPSNAQYRRVVRILRKRYPWVRTWAAWNEANHPKQPTYDRPRRAAQYYNILRKDCHGCRIVAADVLDGSNMVPWVKKFRKVAKKPRIWGLHNYGDSNHFRPMGATATKKLLRAVPGEVWLTEAGGIVRFGSSFRGGTRGEARAARAVKRTFRVARISPRIKRVYLYHWDADRIFYTWDSAFVAANGRARPALDVLRRELNRQRKGRRPAVPPLPKFPRHALPLL
jgi:hypothetical protein